MIVQIYGVQRSGKTTLIERLLNYYGEDAIHIKRSKIQDEYSFNLYGIADKGELTPEQQSKLYELSLNKIKELNTKYKYVFLDYHAGYLMENKTLLDFRPVEYHKIGDIYFYLNTNANIIYDRMVDTNGEKSTYNFSVEDIELYKQLEIEKLTNIIDNEIYIIGVQNDPFLEMIKILGGTSPSDVNKNAWDYKTYDFWLKKYGKPQDMARRIASGKEKIFDNYFPYIGDVKGKKIACICDSCGRLANSLVFNGAEVTVFDQSQMGKKYALECASSLHQKLEYINIDFSKELNQYDSEFDMVISTVGVLHYFMELNVYFYNIKHILKENGIFVIHDFHPILKIINNDSLAVQINDDYFNTNSFLGYMPYNFEKIDEYPKCLYREYMLKDIFNLIIKYFNIIYFDELRYHEEKYPTTIMIKSIKKGE